jgi:hypothetical protein
VNLGGLSPAKQVERNLSHPVVLAHAVHGLSPSFGSGVEGLDRGTLLDILVGFCKAEPSKTGVLSLANGVVKIELSGETPLAIVGVLTADVVRMECEERLIWGHTGRPRIEEVHGGIKLIGARRR